MRKVIVNEFLSLDGVMQGPGGPDEDRRDGFEHGGWSMPYFDEVAMGEATAGMAECGGYLFGRRTYQIMAAHWPSAPDDDPFAGSLNGLPKYVASRTLEEPLEWQNSTLLKGDAAEAVAGLKQEQGKDLVVLGSGDFVQTLMEHDLVDEYHFMVDPIVLGSGHRLFRDGSPTTKLRLVDSKTSGTGVLIVSYAPAER
jgi:dihydrofolate reductase